MLKKTLSKNGLTQDEAAVLLRKTGGNYIYKKKAFSPLISFVKKFNSPLLLILIIVAIGSSFVGEYLNAMILMMMICLSVFLDFINTYKSEKAVDKLLEKIVSEETVYRDGKKIKIPSHEIVPGDLILLEAGDMVPADCQIVECKDFYVNQASLTGESFPVQKINSVYLVADNDFDISNRHLVFMGTSVTSGYAKVVAIKIGHETNYGKIAQQLSSSESETDFEKNIKKFSVLIMKVSFFLVSFVFLINAFLGHGWLNSFLFALAITIGLTPELLPAIISVSLSHGAIQMTKKDVIVRNLSSIQNYGSMDILCTDKTGTLTQNKTILAKHIDCRGNSSEEVLLAAMICGHFHVGINNPLDSAIKAHKKFVLKGYKKVDEIPFDFHRKRDSYIIENNNVRTMITKGAPEEIFKLCSGYKVNSKIIKLNNKNFQVIRERFNSLSQEGFRVLAIASRQVEVLEKYSKKDEEKLTLLGFLVFLDPAKETADEAVKELNNLGIEIKILTGDNELITEKICKDINLEIKGILLGEQIHKMSNKELQNRCAHTTIFARINPEQKERIIVNLREAGHVVGYLGDGINDAPAIKAADIGISVNNAVDVAKDSADIILMRKSLRVLKDGVLEGRKTFRNTLKYIMMGLSSNFGNMFSMMGASVFLPFLPMLPAQVLLNNFIYDTSQLSLTTDSVDKEDIKKPTKWNFDFIKKYMVIFGLVSSIFDFLTYGLLYYGFKLSQVQFQTGWFIESIATQVFVIYMIRTRKIPFLQSRPSLLLFINTFFAVTIAWIIPFTPISYYLGFEPLSLLILFSILFLVILYLVLVEAVKRHFYKVFKDNY